MPYENPGGASSALDFLSSFIAGRNAMQQQNQQSALQEKEANARIAAMNAQTQATKQRLEQEQQAENLKQQRFGLEQQQFGLQQRASGINPATGQPFNFGIGPKQEATIKNPKATPQQKEAIYSAAAAQAMRNGDKSAAAGYSALAKDAADEAQKAQEEALKFMQFAEKLIQDAAQRAHMENQDAAAQQRNAIALARVQVEAQQGAQRIAQGDARLQDEQVRLQLSMRQYGLRVQEVGLTKQRTQADIANIRNEMGARETSRIESAISRLNTQKIPLPQDDPNIGQAIQMFVKQSWAQRAKTLQDARIPASTRAYLNALSTMLPPEQ